MPSNPSTLLSVQRLTRATATGETLLYPVSFCVDERDLIVCQGVSGSGKTILLRSIARLDDTHGEIDCLGSPVADSQIPNYRSKVMYLPQRPQLPPGVVRDALEEPFAWRAHRGKRFDEQAAVTYLQELGLPDSFLDSTTRNLSEGELQIVALVRALLLGPVILLLDEPTSAVDTERTLGFERLVRSWLRDGARAILWVTHSAEQADRLATRRFHLKSGRVSVDV